MIPTLQQLDDISRRNEGDLQEVPFAVLLRALAQGERTGVLEIRRRQMTKRIVLEHGVPVDCRSNLAHETLGRFMVAEGKLSQQDHDRCLRESVSRGVRLGEVLRERGLIDSAELFRILQQNLAKKLLDGFTWSRGAYRLRSEVPAVGSPLKVRVPQLILTGIARFSPQQQVNAGVWPWVGRRLGLHPDPPFPLGRLKLAGEQRRVAELLRRPRDLREVSEASGIPFEEVTRLVYALAVLGAVVPEEELPETGREVIPAWLREPEPPAASTDQDQERPGPEEATRWRNRVMEAYLNHRWQDAFDLLGVDESAPVAALQDAFLAFAHRFAPWRYRQRGLAQVADEARDLFFAGARAFAELTDPERRSTLLYRRKVLAEEEGRKPAAAPRIETDLLDPEKQYEKGRTLFAAGKLREALDLLEFAADCDPQNGLYRAEAAYCRWLLSPTTGAPRALEELGEVLRIAPSCGPAAFYAGEICRELGDLDRAETLLRQANQLMAPDRRPIEALKELARERKRKR